MNGAEEELAELLDQALALEDAARSRFLESLAARDAALAKRVQELLAMLPDPEQTGAERAPDASPDASPDPTIHEPAVGETLGGCVLRGVLGRGGTGTVYAADQLQPPRPVALKILRLADARGSAVRRFRTEAVVLARLEHPAIARIYASGVDERKGVAIPFIVMERIDRAQTFVDWARASGATPREIVARMAIVCDAMQHGHQRQVLHRDLKPSNVLVDQAGSPHVIDFGVARLLERDEDGESTMAGSIIGTPAYMAPEQFELAPSDLDIRIDVHALGVILYEALSGRRPYEIQRHQYFDARRILRDTLPARLDLVDSRIPRDLAAIVAKAMEKDRDRRYASMTELADDLRAFNEGRAVRARPEDAVQRFARTVRRHPAWFMAAGIVFAVLLAATVVTARQLRQAARSFALAQTARVATAVTTGNLAEATVLAEPLKGSIDPRIPAMLLNTLDATDGRIDSGECGSNLLGGALSPDGSRWIASGDTGNFAIVETATGNILRGQLDGGWEFTWACGFNADGTRAYIAGGGRLAEVSLDGAARTIATGGWIQPRGMRVAAEGLPRAMFLSQGVYLATVAFDGSPVTMPSIGVMGRSVAAAAWTDDRTGYLVQGNGQLMKVVLDANGRDPRPVAEFRPPTATGQSAAVSADGHLVAWGLSTGGVRVLDAISGAVRGQAEVGHSVWSMAFSPDGSRLFVGDRSGRVHMFALSAEGALSNPVIMTGGTSSVAWAMGVLSNEEIVVNLGGKVKSIDYSARWNTRAASFGSEAWMLSDFDGRRIRAVGKDGAVRELDMAAGAWHEIPHGAPRPGRFHAISRDGARLASILDDRIAVVDLDTGIVRESGPFDRGERTGAAWSDDGTMVACISTKQALLLDAEAKTLGSASLEGASDIVCLCWHGRDQFLAVDPFDQPRRFAFRFRKGELTFEIEPAPSGLGAIRSQGRWIVPLLAGDILVSWPGGADLLESVQEHYELRLRGHDDYALAAQISPDRQWIATGGADGKLRFWSMRDGEPVFTLPLFDARIRWLVWSKDGSSLLAMSVRGDVRVLDSVPRAERMRSTRDEHAEQARDEPAEPAR